MTFLSKILNALLDAMHSQKQKELEDYLSKADNLAHLEQLQKNYERAGTTSIHFL